MFRRIFVIILLVISVISLGRCWIINNVNFTELHNQSVEKHNEVDPVVWENRSELSVLPPEEVDAMNKLNLIYPGTKWCGTGSIAENEDELGEYADTDRCCREHDHCPDIILAGQTRHNLTNTSYYTRLNCKCDEQFRKCLKTVNSKPSNVIGQMYFNALGTKCFRNDYRVTGCKKTGGWFNTKCVEYAYDKNSTNKLYQWFDLPNF